MAIRSAMLYGTECLAMKHQHVHKCSGNKNVSSDLWRHEKGLELGMKIFEVIWTCETKSTDVLVRRCDYTTKVQSRRGRGRTKKTWQETLKKDLEYLNLNG
ncbi:hypothetical protein DVH24_003896 [Malus domestica]|uniref:Uncharacterized protein n=1 Tax=Malus domestica TaxID=3750 RepID=A0A498KA68_MALDO|nr:hypothetical protein DVH24_003896 [Malus domestica]